MSSSLVIFRLSGIKHLSILTTPIKVNQHKSRFVITDYICVSQVAMDKTFFCNSLTSWFNSEAHLGPFVSRPGELVIWTAKAINSIAMTRHPPGRVSKENAWCLVTISTEVVQLDRTLAQT